MTNKLDMLLVGRRLNVLITGASSGIGAAIAAEFHRHGHFVIALGRTKTPYKNYICDLKDTFEVLDKFQRIIDVFHRVDVLVNCAGIYSENKELRYDIRKIREMFNINLISAWVLSTEFARHRANGGAIINISSVNGISGKCVCDIYDMTKAGMNVMTLNHARTFACKGVRVNAICPSSTVTPMRDKAIQKEHRNKIDEKESRSIPLGRLGNTQDIAGLAYFLGTDQSDYITGQIIAVDGGWLLSPHFQNLK